MYKIYTAGRCKGITLAEAMSWRNLLEGQTRQKIYDIYPKGKDVVFVHPPNYYVWGEQREKKPGECLQWDMNQVVTSDVVVVNLDEVTQSKGTLMELGAAYGASIVGGKKIQILGIGKEADYHWVNEVLWRREDTIEQAAETLAYYCLL